MYLRYAISEIISYIIQQLIYYIKHRNNHINRSTGDMSSRLLPVQVPQHAYLQNQRP